MPREDSIPMRQEDIEPQNFGYREGFGQVPRIQQQKTADEILYVWAKRETAIMFPLREPSYIHLMSEERGKRWFPITEEDFKKATDEIKRIGHKVSYGSTFQKPILTDGQYLIEGSFVRIAKLGFNFTDEVHRYIGISTEPSRMENARNLASKLGLPSPFA